MSALAGDLRYALRALLVQPLFVALAVLCLGLGVGASTMVFSVLNTVLLEPPPFREPERLLAVGEFERNAPSAELPASLPNFLDWQARSAGLAELAAMRVTSFEIGAAGTDGRLIGGLVTTNYLALHGVAPLLGRDFVAADVDGAEPVVMLGEGIWRERFGADRRVIGSHITIDGFPRAIAGVVPRLADPRVPASLREADVFAPLPIASGAGRAERALEVVARLAPGVSLENAAAGFERIGAELALLRPENDGWGVRAVPYGRRLSASTRAMIWLAMGSVMLVFLVACANAGSLMLASAARRSHELAVRAVVGASGARIARQLLLESLMLGCAGAVLGLVIARLWRDTLLRAVESAAGVGLDVPIDATVLGFTVALTFGATVACGLGPAWQVVRGTARAHLGQSGFGATPARERERFQRALVMGQVALALVLLIGASLLLQSFLNLLAVDGGVRTEDLTSIRVDLAEEDLGGADVADYVRSVRQVLDGLPGVAATAAAGVLPLRGGGMRSRIDTGAETAITASYAGVTPEFFALAGVPLVEGRAWSSSDAAGSVAVINETLAARLWGDEAAVGRRFRLAAEGATLTVVGVTRDTANWDAADRPLPFAYVDAETLREVPRYFFVRTAPGVVPPGLEAVTRALEPLDLPIFAIAVVPMADVAAAAFWRQRILSELLGTFGLAALSLTAIGLYGVLTYVVSQRAREIGIRMAFGADRSRVLRMVVRQGAELVAVGVAVGLVGGYLLARVMRGLLYEVEPLDATLFVVATAFLGAVALAASALPAYRATQIDPNALLKQ